MDLPPVLPGEIYCIIASNLLPRYQCRFALASKWCYLYLYTDLLRWHARKALVEIPQYEISESLGAISCADKVVRVYTISKHIFGCLQVFNFTRKINTTTFYTMDRYWYQSDDKYYDCGIYYKTHRYKNILLSGGYYKYVHVDHLLAIVNLSNKILKLPYATRSTIMKLAGMPCNLHAENVDRHLTELLYTI